MMTIMSSLFASCSIVFLPSLYLIQFCFENVSNYSASFPSVYLNPLTFKICLVWSGMPRLQYASCLRVHGWVLLGHCGIAGALLYDLLFHGI